MKSLTAAAKSDSCELTADATLEFDNKFKAMKEYQEWKLEDNLYVEDLMHPFDCSLTREQ